jgi:hypothetical protein
MIIRKSSYPADKDKKAGLKLSYGNLIFALIDMV